MFSPQINFPTKYSLPLSLFSLRTYNTHTYSLSLSQSARQDGGKSGRVKEKESFFIFISNKNTTRLDIFILEGWLTNVANK